MVYILVLPLTLATAWFVLLGLSLKDGKVLERVDGGGVTGEGVQGAIEGVEEPRSSLCEAVDLVYTFVNGSTREHQALQRRYIEAVHFKQNGLENRFRDFGEASTLLYSLRSARKYAPWIRRTWVVVADKKDQTPAFLSEFDGVEVVEHQDIFSPGPGETWLQKEG